jgi:hypothetical protein
VLDDITLQRENTDDRRARHWRAGNGADTGGLGGHQPRPA